MGCVLLTTVLVTVWCGGKDVNTDAPTVLEDQKETMVVQNGDMVSANYIGTSDGVLFDTSFESVAKEYDAENPDSDPIYNEARTYEPLTFEVGAGQMIPGFDNGVVGMEEGETKTLTLEPSDAYGEYNEELIQVVPLSNFTDNNIDIEVGETYNFWFTQWTVLEIAEENEEVTIDFNPKLAGKVLTFEVTITWIDRTQAVEAPVAE